MRQSVLKKVLDKQFPFPIQVVKEKKRRECRHYQHIIVLKLVFSRTSVIAPTCSAKIIINVAIDFMILMLGRDS